MKERILSILDVQRNNAITLKELYRKVGYINVTFEDFCVIIDELLEEKKIYNTGHGYTLNPFREGIYHISRNGDAYVLVDDKKVSIKPNGKYNCMNLDKVLVRITDFNSYTGTVKEIIERHGIIGEVKTINGEKYALVGNDRYFLKKSLDLVDGMLVGLIVDTSKSSKYYSATINAVIGHKTDPNIDLQEILYNYGFIVGFSKEIEEELVDVPTTVEVEDILNSNRVDLRDKMIFTIDGDDTKDIDDAISLEVLDNGNYLLGVHIADVSYYVKENSAIDMQARMNATSVYLTGTVNPMYPRKLSNGICSLNPLVDRFAISCMMEIDNNGNIVDKNIFKSVIHSRKQMTYKNVNSILEKGIVPLGYEEYSDVLKKMEKVANLLHENRVKRGLIEFASEEIKINVDNMGKPVEITKRISGPGEDLIEDFMLAANEVVATYLQDLGVFSIYRVHDIPDLERLKNVLSVMKSYGKKINTKFNGKNPKFVQSLISELKDSDNYEVFSAMILRCMAKAVYQTTNIGHFGIGVSALKGEAYTHFTSPIRRYPDTFIHRILSLALEGNFERLYDEHFLAFLNEICENSSKKEVNADKAEREANKMKSAEYMSEFIGNEYNASISGFTKNGMFVILPNLIEGRIDFRELNDFYRYDEESEIIVGERTKKVYRLGDKLKVRLIRSCKETREIDFTLSDEKSTVARKRKRHGE